MPDSEKTVLQEAHLDLVSVSPKLIFPKIGQESKKIPCVFCEVLQNMQKTGCFGLV